MNDSAPGNALQDATTMMTLLESWVQRQWLREIDLGLTRFLWQECLDASPELLLAIALSSHQLGRGHVCLDLEATLDDPYMALSLPPEQAENSSLDRVIMPAELLSGWTVADWTDNIRHADLVNDGSGQSPLVLDGKRLYLRRYWRHERSVEASIEQLLGQNSPIDPSLLPDLAQRLSTLFPRGDRHPATDWQKIACALAVRSGFSIITGGPGTGKTTTVVKLLALLQGLALNQQPPRPLRIRLTAPTGKAAARLKDAIAGAIDRLPATLLAENGLRAAIPTEAITLHQLLGTRPNTRQFKHNARTPLALDLLVVDEASMVDLEMMAALLAALPTQARLILLGDKDQLASVEAGSVLGQLCRRAQAGHFTRETVDWLQAMSSETVSASLMDDRGGALDQQVVMLRDSHRFKSHSGISQLAAAVNAGDTSLIEQVWQQGYSDLSNLCLMDFDDAEFEALILGTRRDDDSNPCTKGYGHYLAVIHAQHPTLDASKTEMDAWANRVLECYGQFQILCALRKGLCGVEAINQRVADILHRQGRIQATTTWYEGRPVLVTKNDYRLGLMNGDIGITLNYPHVDKLTGTRRWVTRVAFPKTDGSNGIHWILPSRLLAVETVFALTVHKSQGSEFDHCALILPPTRNPVLTRELAYTAITRARHYFTLITLGNPAILHDAAQRTVLRSGGLFS